MSRGKRPCFSTKTKSFENFCDAMRNDQRGTTDMINAAQSTKRTTCLTLVY